VRAFITGASGFIGGHLASRLVRNGWQVRALVHRNTILRPEGIVVIPGDIRDFSLLKDALRGTEVLFHLASALGSSQIPKKEFFKINAEGTRTVLRGALEASVPRIIHFSSAGVLGHVKRGGIVGPKSAYDRSKLEGEKAALEFAREGQNIVVIRPGWAYGPADRRTFKLIRAIARRRFVLVSKGKTLQTPVYIDDLIEGTLRCAGKGKRGEIYNIAGPEALPVKKIAETTAAALGTEMPRISLPLLPTKAAAWTLGRTFSIIKKEAPLNPSRLAFFIHAKPLSIEKAIRELGYAPTWNFEKGMAAAVAWYRANGWL
jgi:dihydroflavonol-4-reductase